MATYPPLPGQIAKEMGIAMFRMAKATSGPNEFIIRLSQVLNAVLIAVTGNLTEEQVIQGMDAAEMLVAGGATQPPGLA